MCSPGCHQKGFIKTDLVGCRYMLFRISWAQVQDLPQINYVDNRKGTLFSWLDYIYIYMALGLIGRDGGLSTLCHRCGFDCQQRVLKKNKKNKKKIYIYIYNTNSAQISQKQERCNFVIYTQSWKQCVISVISNMASW